jgi:hypothetical protein
MGMQVLANITWRRRDRGFAEKALILTDSTDKEQALMLLETKQEYGVITFGARSRQDYFLYYMPYT